ncbi:Riboflavin synthase eubacterial/eukaryotic [Candidatus Nasuia deltocephalinicola]|uniref:Riboflavin synthase n=1 Tax=Candidatus Nasuia deltocephalincola TaxID=1160784 RepID=A0A7G6UHV6_9PROT|nr:Riboflavin synthase eubacterial/eukaryotic [Candidatus Nasuia deltocephalinicola]
MFNGIISLFLEIFFLKYSKKNNFFFIKLHKKFFDTNIGDSLSIQGICLTLVNKYLFLFEFEFSYMTFLNISNFKKKYFNIEKSLKYFNYIGGHVIISHNNNLFLLKNIFLYFNILKIYLLCSKNFKNFIFYKNSISINGVSLTINEILIFKNYILISFNLLKFTYNFTNIKFYNIFEFINIEFDLNIFFTLSVINDTII